MLDVAVVGLVTRDLVVAVDALPDAGGSAPVTTRREQLGGAANQAVGCRQLGLTAAVAGVVGDDDAGTAVLQQARRDGIDVTGTARRRGVPTALVVDVVEPGGRHRLLEHVPEEVLLTEADVRAAEPVLRSARAVLVDLQQPARPALAAARAAAGAGALVLLDGATADPAARAELLAAADVARADASEVRTLAGRPVEDVPAAVDAAAEVLAAGPSVVALAVGDANVVVWEGGNVVMPLLGERPTDPTGGGDAFVVGLVAALLDGHDRATAAWWASAAAALAVDELGGRPDLDRGRVEALARSARS
ncbi:ribokinase [Georgenia soli]|uniref:Ribokinase n=1 Tax=Georgenia soli TaxID=638953 RepID=A0A2A9ENM3_9MICO|nr:PfkB family carbohydrate kinase [Georgenia soli]PFG40508.1 ribokinase [Georgenia soli]